MYYIFKYVMSGKENKVHSIVIVMNKNPFKAK